VEQQPIPAAVLKVARALLASGFDASALDAPAEDDRPPYTVPEAARLLKVDPSTLYRAIDAGEIDAYSVGQAGRAIRIPAAEFDAFKARRMIAGKARRTACRPQAVA
jgi:excisionase family DNA binding protein